MANNNDIIRKNQCDICKKPFPVDYNGHIAGYGKKLKHKLYTHVTFTKCMKRMILHDIGTVKIDKIVCENCNYDS